MKCLVAGGAGYIGSHVVLKLIEQGHDVDIIDDLSTGSEKSLNCLSENGWKGKFCKCDVGDIRKVSEFIQLNSYDVCLYFAGLISVGESVKQPIRYYQNNVSKLPEFLSSLMFHGVNKFIFSSSAGVYGQQEDNNLIREDAVLNPSSPYGMTKLMSEQILKSCSDAYPQFKYTCLRYFNVAGNNMDRKIGDYNFESKSNLIPMCCSAAMGSKPSIKIYGTDYNTADGTCIRDYIHVDDLAEAHVVMLDKVDNTCYNVGNGVGYSVREVVDSCLKRTAKNILVEEEDRRPGDPDYLCADPSRFKKRTGWEPNITDIDDITASAWNWIKKERRIP